MQLIHFISDEMKILSIFMHTAKRLFLETKFLEAQMIDKCQPLNSSIKDRENAFFPHLDFADLIRSIAENC